MIVTRMRKLGAPMQEAVSKGVKENAFIFMNECVSQIDAMIYSQPQSDSDYKRTKHLRRSHHLKQLGWHTWLLYNDAAYAIPVHNGYRVHGSGRMMPAKPWMETAINNKKDECTERLRGYAHDCLKGYVG
jgi:hypothetical protein